MSLRTGDTVKISGDYQYQALTGGNPVQRFWHYSKQLSILRYLPPLSTDCVMDVGCGSGVITDFLGRSAQSILGIDGNVDAIRFATENFSRENVRFELNSVDNVDSYSEPMDKIYCLEVIEHIYESQARNMLQSFLRILRPGGKVFLTTPNYRSLWPFIEWSMDTLCLAPPLLDHQHVEFYNMKKLARLCKIAGFDIVVTASSCFLAPWLSPLSWKLAEKMDSIESKFPFSLGSILIFVIAKPEK